MVRLNRTHYSLLKHYLLLKFTGKISQFFKIVPSSQNSSELRRFRAVRPHSPRITRNLHIFYLCFRHLPRQRTIQNSSELCKFRAIRPHSPRMTRNSHHLFTLYIMFQISDHRQRTQENWSESTRFCSIHPLIT